MMNRVEMNDEMLEQVNGGSNKTAYSDLEEYYVMHYDEKGGRIYTAYKCPYCDMEILGDSTDDALESVSLHCNGTHPLQSTGRSISGWCVDFLSYLSEKIA